MLVAALLTLVVAFAWFTRNPEAPAVDRATEWPWIGKWIGRLQDQWRPPPIPADRSAAAASEPAVVIRYYPAHPPPPRDYVWIAGGTALRAEPSVEAAPVLTIDETTNLFVHERRGDWVKVHRGAVEGWVMAPPGAGVAGPRSDRPEPVLPLPGRAPDAADLRRSLEIFSSPPRLGRLDPYLLYTDLAAKGVGPFCRELVAQAEERWTARYGVAPVGQAEEAILIFADREGYEDFAELAEGGPLPPGTTGHAARGLVATFAGERSPAEICRSLLHEIAHLLERRSLGPALPPWLGEGLARDFTDHLLDDGVDVARVAAAVRGGTAPGFERLTGLDHEAFHGAGRTLHYDLSQLWIGYLLGDAELEDGFRYFLDYLSRGGPWADHLGPDDFPRVRATPTLSDDLLHFLARDGLARDGLDRERERLEAGFRAWLWARGGG